jgi:hypothetical protein
MGSLVTWFDSQFVQLYVAWCDLITQLKPSDLYQSSTGSKSASVGASVVKSAGIVEQAFGGITANLWDDPFEWTLPETLTSTEKLLEYFEEVEATRRRGFEFFKDDGDLLKAIMTPAGEKQLATLLLDTLVRARHYQLRADETSKEIKQGHRRANLTANLA